ncbi:CDP-alcohol phosphatidyltransferase family protein [Chloroflexota bacterium]
MSKHNLTIDEIRASFPSGKAFTDSENPLGTLVWRPLSYYPTWLFLRLGVSANQVTALAIAVGITGCLLIALGFYWSAILGVLFILLRALLDYTDGNVARCTNSTSRFGGYLDTIHQYTVTSLLPVGLGIGLFLHPDPALQFISRSLFGLAVPRGLFLIAGFSSAFLTLFTYCISDRFAISFAMKPRDFYRPSPSEKRSIWRLIFRVGLMLENVNSILMPVLLLAAIFKFLSVFLILWGLITFSGFVAIATRTMIRARKIDG